MKLLLSIIFSISCVSVVQAQAEKRVSAEINVSAQVVQSIELITINSIEFGSVQPGQRELYINPVHSVNAAYMIAIGTPEAQFRLSYLPIRELTQSDGDGSLTFTYEISGSIEENQSTSEILENDNRHIEFNNEGRYYIWLGGRVNLENAKPGSYQGDFTIEIDYI